jgi:hypothetical protein
MNALSVHVDEVMAAKGGVRQNGGICDDENTHTQVTQPFNLALRVTPDPGSRTCAFDLFQKP